MKKLLLIVVGSTLIFSSCTTIKRTMKEPNIEVHFTKNDFTLSEQVSAEASSFKIIGIDFSRLFLSKEGNIESSAVSPDKMIANLPIIGNIVSEKTANYALYELMNNNPGYDAIIYPQYEYKIVRPLGVGIIKKVNVKVTARLGKLK